MKFGFSPHFFVKSCFVCKNDNGEFESGLNQISYLKKFKFNIKCVVRSAFWMFFFGSWLKFTVGCIVVCSEFFK